MNKVSFIIGVLIIAAGAGTARSLPQSETSTAGRPKFDAISIKANKTPGVGVGRINLAQPGGHVSASNVSLKFLAIQAYQFARVHFGPDPKSAGWIESEHFDIEAEVDGNPTVEQKRLMLQSMLADRFKFAIHHETQELPIYALVLAKRGKLGPQLRPHDSNSNCVEVPPGASNPPLIQGAPLLAPCGGIRIVRSDLVGQNVTMEQLARILSVPMRREVADRTGLDGTFDMKLHFQVTPLDVAPSTPDPSAPPNIFTALREQLGLKLETQTGPVDVIMIDHVEEPTPN